MKNRITSICCILLAISTGRLIAQDTLVMVSGDNGTFNVGFYSDSNRFGFKATGSANVGFSAIDNTTGFRAEGNSQDGFKSMNNTSYGFRAEGNGTGFRAYQNNFQGFHSQENTWEGFLATQNGTSGFRATHNQKHGFDAAGNAVDGFFSQINMANGFNSIENEMHGYRAAFNIENGFFSVFNELDGYYASDNVGDGFRCESTGAHAGYFVNNDSTNFPAVFIDHGHMDSTDLKFGGDGHLAADEHIYLDLDADDNSGAANLIIRSSEGSQLAVLSEAGHSDINTSLDVTGGNLNVTAGNVCANNVTCSSDQRFKKDVSPITNPLKKVLSLKGVTYKWNQEKWPSRFNDRPQLGFIAQDLEAILPELVHTNAEGYKSVDYIKITAVLVEAIKELKVENDSIKRENAEISAKLAKMESLAFRIGKLEEKSASRE